MIWSKLVFNDEEYKYLQLYRFIKNSIETGLIDDREKLPSIRELSRRLSVNTVTIINAYKKLESDGYIAVKSGSGAIALKKQVIKNFRKEYAEVFKRLSSGTLKTIIDLTGELNSGDFFSMIKFKEIINEVLERDGTDALIYQETLGYEGLRQCICNNFWSSRYSSDEILILSGAQQGIDIISRVLINSKDNVLVEKPTYSGALSVFSFRRANILEVAMEEDGINIDSFEKYLKKYKIKCFYTMSYFQNPTGASYSLDKKIRILELAEKYDFYIIEDDYLSELIYDNKIEYASFKALDKNDRVIYIKSFSKVFLTGIRLGYLISPVKLREAIESIKVNTDIATSSIMQRVLELYIDKGYWKEHIGYLNDSYKDKYNKAITLLDQSLGNKVSYLKPGGGLNIFIRINDYINVDSYKLFYLCKEEGVIITPGGIYFKNFEEGSRYFRIGFTQGDSSNFKEGLKVIDKYLV